MVQNAVPSDLPGVRSLWKTGFGESEEFLNFYFGERYDHSNTVVFRDGDFISSSAQIVPFEMKYRSEIIKSAYILGVVTHPDYRKKGQAAELLKYSLNDQYRREILVSTLIPQFPYLFDIYRKYGFYEAFEARETLLVKKDYETEIFNGKITALHKGCLADLDLQRSLFRLYDREYRKLGMTLLKSFDDFKFTLKEFLLFEGPVIVSFDENGEPAGIAFVSSAGESGKIIKELICSGENVRKRLIGFILREYGLTEITVLTPQNVFNGKIKPLGMGRIVNAYEMLKIFAKSGGSDMTISITDNIVKQNNKIFTICGNEISDCEPDSRTTVDYQYDIYELSRLLLSESTASYMNLMLN